MGCIFQFLDLINKTTQPPYGGILNIANASVTQYKLTGFRVGYEYNITVCGFYVGRQKRSESEPLTITPQGTLHGELCVL